MEIDESDLNFGVEPGQDPVRFPKGAIDVRHEGASLKVNYGVLCPVPRLGRPYPDTGQAVGIVGRAEQPRLVLVVIVNLAFIEAVIATGNYIESQREQVFGNRWCNTESTGTIFAVGYGQIDFPFGNDPAQVVDHHSPTGGSENVADEEDIH